MEILVPGIPNPVNFSSYFQPDQDIYLLCEDKYPTIGAMREEIARRLELLESAVAEDNREKTFLMQEQMIWELIAMMLTLDVKMSIIAERIVKEPWGKAFLASMGTTPYHPALGNEPSSPDPPRSRLRVVK